jgi:3-deoxy-7-phosphoheptulonate synthase
MSTPLTPTASHAGPPPALRAPRLVELTADADAKAVGGALAALGLWPTPLRDLEGRVSALSVHPSSAPCALSDLMAIPGVARVLGASSPHPLVDTLARRPVEVAGYVFGEPSGEPTAPLGGRAPQPPLLIAGPCSVESERVLNEAADLVVEAGAQWIRGGAYKPRTSPYAFQGKGDEALRWLRAAADARGLRVVTEALSEVSAPRVAEWSDVVQIGTRNMQNFALLKAVGATGRPALLKRGLCATVEEWLLAGEYLMSHGCPAVVFCERGLRSFDEQTRNLLDLGAVALLKHTYGLPVVVDPSHAAGRRDLVAPLSRAALAVGADGVMVEAHPNAAEALSDGPQALSGAELRHLAAHLRALSLQLPPLDRARHAPPSTHTHTRTP